MNKGTTKTALKVGGSVSLRVHVYDVAGELVNAPLQLDGVKLDASSLSCGLYFVVVDLTDTATGHSMGRQVTQIAVQW